MMQRVNASRSAIIFATRRTWPMLQMMLWLPVLLAMTGETYMTWNSWRDPFRDFVPYSVNVPNHCAGENPIIHVTRAIHGYAKGSFHTQFMPVNGGGPVCAADSLAREYRPQARNLYVPQLYSYFGEGRDCRLPAGVWRGDIQWTFRRPWHQDAQVSLLTNAFEVWDAGDPRCVAR